MPQARLKWGQTTPLTPILALFLLGLFSCTLQPPVTPDGRRLTSFVDDGDNAKLLQAVQRQQEYLQILPPQKKLFAGSGTRTARQYQEGLQLFTEIISRDISEREKGHLLLQHFTLLPAPKSTGHPAGEVLVTAYYEPATGGSLTRNPPFCYPLYTMPQEGCRLTRKEIEETQALKGHELVYLQNRWEAFVLQVQGSGRIRLQDGRLARVHFTGDNGQPYHSIGRELVTSGRMALEDVTMESIHTYLLAHPDEEKELLYANRRYIFFDWDKNPGQNPQGSIEVELTEGRSIAIDGETLPYGTVGYLVTRIPKIGEDGTFQGWKKLHRFVVPQDSGSAIKGNHVDLFLGNGIQAKRAAGLMKEEGRLYFFVPKGH